MNVTKMKSYLSRNVFLKIEKQNLKGKHYRHGFEDTYKYVKGNTNRIIFCIENLGEEKVFIYSVPYKMHSLTTAGVGTRLRNSSKKVSD